jgi:uncharacterized membrane protein YjfL (UPF0719 family)
MDWFLQHVRPIVDSIVYSLIGSGILFVAFWIIQLILPFSMEKEIAEDQNVSLGIVLGAFIIGLSIIISTAIK